MITDRHKDKDKKTETETNKNNTMITNRHKINNHNNHNHNHNDLVIEKKYSNIMFTSSFLMLPLSIHAYKLNFKKSSAINFLLFCSSINYWRDPRYGKRRNFDILTTSIQVLMNLKMANKMNSQMNRFKYYFVLSYVIMLYKISWVYHYDYPLFSSLCHSMIHVIGFCGNYLMYYKVKKN